MVFDPFTTFAVSCNVLQVVEAGIKVLSKAVELYKSSQGILKEQVELHRTLTQLVELNTDLASRISSSSNSNDDPAVVRIVRASVECLEISKKLINLLSTFEARGKFKLLDSIQKAYKIRSQSRILARLEGRLSEAKSNLNLCLLVHMNSQQATEAGLRELDKATEASRRQIIEEISASSQGTENEILRLARDIETFTTDNKTLLDLIRTFQAENQARLLSLELKLSSVQQSNHDRILIGCKTKGKNMQREYLSSLYFLEIEDRYHQIRDPHEGTFGWILDPALNLSGESKCFYSWISSADDQTTPLFWVSSVPGSGKSTLMKHIDREIKCLRHLTKWAGGSSVYIAKFFFWNAGSRLQKSFLGLLRSLIHQLLQQLPSLFTQAFAGALLEMHQWQDFNTCTWTVTDLKTTLEALIMELQPCSRIFFLIDALDELDGYESQCLEMLDYFSKLSHYEGVRFCVASRPWGIFRDYFKNAPQFRLEKLTYRDMIRFVESQIAQYCNFKEVGKDYDIEVEELVEEIVRKSEGCFLWVRLAVMNLI